MLFPEFKEARDWQRTALERLYRQLDDEVYPDGMQYELAGGYNNWVVTEFAHILELADLNDVRREVPGDFLAKMEKMFNYLLFASLPNGQIPGLNDANNADIRASWPRASSCFHIARTSTSSRRLARAVACRPRHLTPFPIPVTT